MPESHYRPDYSRPEANHAELYRDPAIFAEELDKIFHATWVYVGHESEIPNPGDYKTSFIGRVPVILSRDLAGKIHVVANRCTHRGSTVCAREFGHAESFTCPYHAWTFRLDGSLEAVGLPRGYNDGELDFAGLGLPAAPRIGSYRGFVFASLNPDVHDFDTHIGRAKKYIDYYCDLSPSGQITVGRTGIYKHRYRGNWKAQLEGSVEGYHVWHNHRTAIDIMSKWVPIMKQYQNLPMKAYDLGFGHNIIENYTLTDAQVHERWPAELIEQLISAHGRQRAMDALRHRFNIVLFPNMAILEYHVRVIRPLAADLTEVRQYHTSMVGLPAEMNLRRVREHEFFYGPGGFGGPDDLATFDRIQQGMEAYTAPWVLFNRGLKSEETTADGLRFGHHTQETQQRAPYYEYRRLMEGKPPAPSRIRLAAAG